MTPTTTTADASMERAPETTATTAMYNALQFVRTTLITINSFPSMRSGDSTVAQRKVEEALALADAQGSQAPAISETNASTERDAPKPIVVHQALLDALSEILGREEAVPVKKRRLSLDERESIEAAIGALAKMPRAGQITCNVCAQSVTSQGCACPPAIAAPKEAAEPTREASREASIRIDEIVAWLNRPANKARIEGNLRLAAEAIAELDRARRVSWEDMNTPLGVAAPRTEVAAVAPDAVANLIVRGDGTGVLMGLGGDYLSKLPKGAYPLYTHPAAPSNVREQALDQAEREARMAVRQWHRDMPVSLAQYVGERIRALKSATPDAGNDDPLPEHYAMGLTSSSRKP